MFFVSFFFLHGVTLYVFPGLLTCLRDREAPLLSYLHNLEIVRNVGNVEMLLVSLLICILGPHFVCLLLPHKHLVAFFCDQVQSIHTGKVVESHCPVLSVEYCT